MHKHIQHKSMSNELSFISRVTYFLMITLGPLLPRLSSQSLFNCLQLQSARNNNKPVWFLSNNIPYDESK